jgi:hypothetical protein
VQGELRTVQDEAVHLPSPSALPASFASLPRERVARVGQAPVFVGLRADDEEWIRNLRLSPLPGLLTDEQLFAPSPVFQQAPATFRGRQPVDAQVEMTAFQFQR